MTIANSLERIATALEALTSGMQGQGNSESFLSRKNGENVTTNTVAGMGTSNFGSPAEDGGLRLARTEAEAEAVEYGVLYKDADAVPGGVATHTGDGDGDSGTHVVSTGGGLPANDGRRVVSTGTEYPTTRRSWWPTVLAIADIAAESTGMMDGREWLAGMDQDSVALVLSESGLPSHVVQHYSRGRARGMRARDALTVAAYAETGTIAGTARVTGVTPVKVRRSLVAAGVLGESAA